MLVRSSNQSLAEQLAARFAQRIRDRLLAPGARLPSVRQCAQQQRVSPSTVVGAYDQLLAQGLVEARKNRGFFVREQTVVVGGSAVSGTSGSGTEGGIGAGSRSAVSSVAHGVLPGTGRTPATVHAAPLNATALIRAMFHGISDKPQPGMGVLPPQWLEASFLTTAVRRSCTVGTLNSISLQYGEPMGDTALRRALSLHLADLSVPAAPAQIITTVGATHALDIVSRTLLVAGDYVMVEEPGWAVEFARLGALGMRILPVPRRADGPDLEVMARYCEAHHPKLFVSVSVYHNPTGFCLNPASAHRIVQLANRYGFHIVEDDTYSHFAPSHATRLSALDGLQRTIYVGGFAKVLAPNWRVGYLAAPPELVERLLDTKLLATLTTPALLERALAWCMEQGQLRRHAQRLRTRLDAARNRSVQLALEHGFGFAAEPVGIFGWLETGVDTDALSQRMLDEGYLLAPGALFHANRTPSSLMRINFSTTQEPVFWETLVRLCCLNQVKKVSAEILPGLPARR